MSSLMVLSGTEVKFVNQAVLPALREHALDPTVQLVGGIFRSCLHSLGPISGLQSEVAVHGGG